MFLKRSRRLSNPLLHPKIDEKRYSMRENYELTVIESSELSTRALTMKRDNARLVQICAVSIPDGYELSYSFAKGYEFINYRIVINENEKIPSIGDIYPSAVFYENEMKELFGVNIEAMYLDYNNKLYRIEQETPFKK